MVVVPFVAIRVVVIDIVDVIRGPGGPQGGDGVRRVDREICCLKMVTGV